MDRQRWIMTELNSGRRYLAYRRGVIEKTDEEVKRKVVDSPTITYNKLDRIGKLEGGFPMGRGEYEIEIVHIDINTLTLLHTHIYIYNDCSVLTFYLP